MTRALKRLGLFLAAAILMFAGTGFIHRVYSLKEVVDESTNIMVGKIDSVDKGKNRIIASVGDNIKGTSPFKKIQMNIAAGDKQFHEFMVAKIRPGMPISVFYKLEGRSIACLCYVDRFWFQLFSEQQGDLNKVWWNFSHVEIYMPRTWNGTQADLMNEVGDVLAKRSEGPKPNTKLKPIDVQRELAGGSSNSGGGSQSGPDTAGKIFGRYVALKHAGGETRGAVWVDYDGDGDLDAYFCTSSGNHLYRYDGGTNFRDVTKEVGLSGGSRAGAWADYNGDGRLDLLLSTPKLYTNRGDKFADDTGRLPKLSAYNTEGCGWIDYDGDGASDILLTNGEYGIFVFKNEQKGESFRDVSRDVGLGSKGPGAQNGDFVSIADWDGDGFSDFLYNVGSGLLFRNTGEGKFVLAGKSGVRYDTANDYKVGSAWGDYDKDGDLDLFVPQNNVGKLFRNENNGKFTDVTNSAGDLNFIKAQWTVAAWGDLTGDGWLDLYVGKANGDSRLYVNQRDGRFENMVEELGLYHRPGNRMVMGAALGDFDRDGDLDILANSSEGHCTVFINDLTRSRSTPTYLAVRPKGTASAVGATVRLFDSKDKLMGLCELGTAQNMGSQSPLGAVFGVPKGKFKVTICMSDGGFGERVVEVGDKGMTIEIGAEER